MIKFAPLFLAVALAGVGLGVALACGVEEDETVPPIPPVETEGGVVIAKVVSRTCELPLGGGMVRCDDLVTADGRILVSTSEGFCAVHALVDVNSESKAVLSVVAAGKPDSIIIGEKLDFFGSTALLVAPGLPVFRGDDGKLHLGCIERIADDRVQIQQ